MKNYTRYVIGVVLLIVAILLIVLGFRVIQGVFTSDESQQEKQEQKQVRVTDAARNNRPVEYTVYGAIVGNEEFRSIRITVDGMNRKAEVLQGYNQAVLKAQNLPNTQDAYQAFVEALQGAGFGNSRESLQNEMEICPLGRRFTFVINPNSTSDKHRTWSSSCGSAPGTFAGNRSTVQQLFQDQIPGYNQFVSGVRL